MIHLGQSKKTNQDHKSHPGKDFNRVSPIPGWLLWTVLVLQTQTCVPSTGITRITMKEMFDSHVSQ